MRVIAAVKSTSESYFPSSFLETYYCPLLCYECSVVSLYGFSGKKEPKKINDGMVPTYCLLEIRKNEIKYLLR